MKIRSRNLLTAILALLCAVTLIFGIAFMLPKSEKINADAAVAVNRTSYTPTFIGQHFILSSNASRQFSDFSTTLNPSLSQINCNNNEFTITKELDCYSIASYIQFTADIVVPANTEYKVEYSYTLNLDRLSLVPGTEANCVAEIFYFGNTANGGSDQSTTITYNVLGGSGSTYSSDCISIDYQSNETRTKTLPSITYSNTTNSDKTFTAYFGYFGGSGRSGGAGNNKIISATYNLTMDEKVTAEKAVVTVDKNSDVYDANGTNFLFNYDQSKIELKSIDFTDFDGVSSNYYNGSGVSPINSFGSCSLIGAGVYKFKFDIKNGAVWDTSTNDQMSKIITVTVTRKGLTLPTGSSAQEYTGGALTYVLSDFNGGQNISMDGVVSSNGSSVTGAGGSALTDTTDTFEAVKVGRYTVTLGLRDKKNYTWTDGTTAPKSVVFEITEKELLSAGPVSSSLNGIGGAEWGFGDNGVTITVTDDRVSGENINLLCYYDVAGGTDKSKTLTATTTGNVTTVTMPANIPVGKYTFYVELNGNGGDNANYKLTQNNSLDFEVTSGKIDPSTYGWIYTKDGAAGATIANGGKVPFALKSGSAVDGVKYELSIQIPAGHSSVVVDTSKYAGGYQTRSGSSVGKYTTKVALKSTDPTFKFEVGGVMQSTIDVELNWEIEKGRFDLSGVKWEYSVDGTNFTDYDPSNPPQYNDGNYITVRVKAASLPMGLNLDALYTGSDEYDVDNYTASISVSDFVYNTANFNAPDTSLLDLNWEIVKKNLYTGFKNVAESYTNGNGTGTIIIKRLNVDPKYDGYITYKYYDLSTGLAVTLADIKTAADPTNEKKYKVEAYIDSAYASNYAVDDNGVTPNDSFTTGSKNKLATATIDGNDGTTPITAEYDGTTHFDSTLIKITGSDSINITDFTVTYYDKDGTELAAGELPKDAGAYTVYIKLGAQAEKKYILGTDRFTVVIEAKGIALPTLDEMVFNGQELNFEDYLGGSWNDYKGIIKLDGKLTDRNVGAGGYVTTLELTDGNYKWQYPSKTGVKHGIAAQSLSVSGDDKVAVYNWNISPIIVDTTNLWNKGAGGATLNLPQNVKDLIAGGTLELGYRYYDGSGQLLETPELKGGRSFKVEAVFGGDDAERNVQFRTGEATYGAVSKSIDYTVPQSGAAAFMNTVKDFMTGTWLGLPVWSWFLIGLALLILLIIIIVVAAKRRKSKEEREAKKAAKEEEKARREEERRLQQERLEEERRLQREKLEAEREIAKAKQEAELEKIRAQAQLSGAGIASVAAAVPQAVQQPQPQTVQQTIDNNALARIEAEIARINDKISNQQPAQPQYINLPMPQQPQQQYISVPMQQQMQPQMMPVPIQQQLPMMPMGGGHSGEFSDLRADVRSMREEQRSEREVTALRREMELEFAKLRADGMYGKQTPAQISMPANVQGARELTQNGQPAQDNSAEMMGAIMAAFVKNIAANNYAVPVAETVQEPQEEQKPNVASTSASYPSNAVITTTTTVDTTKSGKSRNEQLDDGRLFDIDGFYDTFDSNK